MLLEFTEYKFIQVIPQLTETVVASHLVFVLWMYTEHNYSQKRL